ncbi:MAG: aminotransferase class IV [Candidatus Marinimicrobia bacterium]|nr:aminotransferase class IV [Candidatus Neomarinimicrobiota bacterium]
MQLYINGKWVGEAEATVPFRDRGFQLGESLFETIRVNGGHPFRVQKHMERMQSGMDTIQLDAPTSLEQIPGLVDEYIERNKIVDSLVRIMITRGTSAPGAEPAIYISSRELPPVDSWPVKVVFLEEKNYPILRFHPAIKSGNYLGNMLAKRDAEQVGAFEPVFINPEGYITECAIRNVFFIKNGTLYTPSLELGVLPGVIRDTIMELARKRGLQVEESFIRAERVDAMDVAFISSTGVGVLPIFWDGFQSNYDISQELRNDLTDVFEAGERNVT